MKAAASGHSPWTPMRGDDDADADQLQRDVGHQGEDAGERDGDGEPAVAVASAHEVGEGDVAVAMADGPQAREDEHHVGIGEDRVGQGEEADRAGAVERRGDGDDGVGGVEIAADQEPGDPGAEAAPGEAPLFKRVHACSGPAPARGPEAGGGDQREEDAEDRQGCGVQVCH